MGSISLSLVVMICCASVLAPKSFARPAVPEFGCPRCLCCSPPIIPIDAARPSDPDVVIAPIDPEVDLPIRTPIRPPIRTPFWPPIRTPPPPPPRVKWPPIYCCRCCRFSEPIIDPALPVPDESITPSP